MEPSNFVYLFLCLGANFCILDWTLDEKKLREREREAETETESDKKIYLNKMFTCGHGPLCKYANKGNQKR